MLFTDAFFLFYFLPFALTLHTLSTRFAPKGTYGGASRIAIFLLTLFFYGFREPWWLFPFLVCIGFDFIWASWLSSETRPGVRKFICFLSVFQNLSLLGLFKYWQFIRLTLCRMVPSADSWLPQLLHAGEPLALPPGISFYTFESLSFVIDIYRRQVTRPKSPLEFFAFIGMFPRFIAGPIVRYRDMVGQFKNYAGPQIEVGLFLFIIGLFLKSVFADQFAVFVPYAFNRGTEGDFVGAWLGTIAYTCQIYFDFSGYSLMAIGLGRCLGFQFPTNFNQPYRASNLQDFWRRWHMTLSSWLRDYLYIPLGGSHGSVLFTYRNLFLTMLLGGLWHGANWTFVIWGAWHGLWLCLERAGKFQRRLPPLVLRVLTLLIVLVGWVFFRSSGTREVTLILGKMISFDFSRWNPAALGAHPLSLLLAVSGIIYLLWGERKWNLAEFETMTEVTPVQRRLAIGLAVVSLITVFSATTIPFLYFQF